MMETRSPFSTPRAVNNNNCRRNFSDLGMAGDGNASPFKRSKMDNLITAAQSRFSSPVSDNIAPRRSDETQSKKTANRPVRRAAATPIKIHKQFWKAGDYDGAPQHDGSNWELYAGGSDHIRVHPRFLHSNATSHRWVLGAFAELLDNSLDEFRNGASFVNIDMVKNKKNGGRMLVIEDNGGGMDPVKMRQCMSLGYSAKSKIANTIGQYGNGFKTSTMRLGADVVVFSRNRGRNGNKSTQSVGLLSYTFLRCTQKEDIEVPMLDFESRGQNWEKIVKSSDWNDKVNTIVKWSPFCSEAVIMEQFDAIQDQGTRIFIYNLWEDDQSQLELDFDVDPHDIQIRGANRDEKNIQMANQYPNSRHFLTYKHSLRSYASILYLKIPRGFRMYLRGKEIEHHNIVNDMMMSQMVNYRPQHIPDTMTIKESSDMLARVTIGFVKDAKAHIDVQGFNVYHKNRLIKPFWRVWNPSGSDGRCVIGVLEANFVEPAHDKQGFEKTIALQRLEAKLAAEQKNYWSTNCHLIGYAPRRNKKAIAEKAQEAADTQGSSSPELNAAAAVPLLRRSVFTASKSPDKNRNGNVSGSLDDPIPLGRKNVSLASKSNGNVTRTLNGARENVSLARKSVSLPSKSTDESPTCNIVDGTLNVKVSVPSNSMDGSPNGNFDRALNGAVSAARKNVSLPLKSMDKGPNGNITGTLNVPGKNVSLSPKSLDRSPTGNISETLNGTVSVPVKNISLPSSSMEKSGNVVNNDPGSSKRVHNNVHSSKTIHKKKKNSKLCQVIQRDLLPFNRRRRADDGRPSQKNSHPPPLPPMVPPEKPKTVRRSMTEEYNFRKTVELRPNLGLESSESSHESSISTEKRMEEDPSLVESLKMNDSSLLKDLELVRKKCNSLEAELDQERNKCKPLVQELDQERNKCKFLVAELNQEKEKCKSLKAKLDQENGKCKSLESELNQERGKRRSLQSEYHELSRGRDYLIDVFSDALNSRKGR